MKHVHRLAGFAFIGALLVANQPVFAKSQPVQDEPGTVVDITQVPHGATEKARETICGPITEIVKVEEESGHDVYEFRGKNRKGNDCAVHVRANGNVMTPVRTEENPSSTK